MKGFMLDENGDILIKNGQIQMIDGNELLRQTVQSVLGTNKGEWILNRDEGITFSYILGKGNSEDVIRNEIEKGLKQVDDTFIVTSFEMNTDRETRKATITFKAVNSTGDEIDGTNTYN